jgi:hypothetical protein
MLLSDAYSRIVWKLGSPDDTSGRAINPQVSNKMVLFELYDQMVSYANITKGIQDVFSFSQNKNITFVSAPSLALRSKGYFYGYVIVNGTRFPFDFRGGKDVFTVFRTAPISGIINWVMPWNAGHSQYLSGFPKSSSDAKTTTLSADITATSTTITVASTSGFVADFGRVTIGTEKILYQYKDDTHFYGCQRGVEQTTAAIHSSGDTLTENNVILLYSRLPVYFEAESDDTISAATQALVLEPCDEHMEGIIKSTTYNLLMKIDIERAAAYKVDKDVLYSQYEKDIRSGYARSRMNVNIRDAYFGSEAGIAYGTNLY